MDNALKSVAVIMDGNGRWATHRNRPRIWGHVRGTANVRKIINAALKQKIEVLTLYAFSIENFSRPQNEKNNLFKLLHKYLIRESISLIENNICFKIIGDYSFLPKETIDLIHDLEKKSSLCTELKLNFAFGYGAKQEICRCVNEIKKDQITENDIDEWLKQNSVEEVDLLIRTGGDVRISNFLLWQIAYAELYFSNTAWPDFTEKEFHSIIEEVNKKERRFGNIK